MASRTRASAPALLLAALLAGCSGGEPGPAATVTTTVTANPPVSAPPASPVVAATADADAEIEGRAHDVGTIVGTSGTAAAPVLVLDRWTVEGVPDSVLARDGVPVALDPGGRFQNLNRERTYDVPVAPDVSVVVNTCVPPSRPGLGNTMTSTPETLARFLALPDRAERVTMLTYVGGRLTRLETNPRC